jgi:hypothetical protein
MSDPTLSAEQIIALDYGIQEWENHGGPVLNHLVPVVARMIAKAEQRGRDEVTAAVETVLPSPLEVASGVSPIAARIRNALADPAAHVAAIKADAWDEGWEAYRRWQPTTNWASDDLPANPYRADRIGGAS